MARGTNHLTAVPSTDETGSQQKTKARGPTVIHETGDTIHARVETNKDTARQK